MSPDLAGPVGSARAQTKVVATIGPATEERIGELIDAGLSVARINFSHGEHAEHRRRVDAIRREADARGVPIGILADIQGPKLRLGRFAKGKRRLRRGDVVRLREGSGVAADGELNFGFPGFLEAVDVGHRVFLADGVAELVVEERGEEAHTGRVVRGGPVGDKKGVNLPDSKLVVELPTPKDKIDLSVARDIGVDMIGVSFVGDADDVRQIRKLAPDCLIVAKIERAIALEHIEEILDETDGIMVARGDLGVELELERLPMMQKSLIQSAARHGVFTITATEMLESMVQSPRPTRAEAADVANAVLDGTDAVMLSAETAVGEYPVEAVATMIRIASAVESSKPYQDRPLADFRESEATFSNATARAAVEAAEALDLGKIVCFTESGNTARLVSRYRPGAEVIALSPRPTTLRRISVMASVRPLPFPSETRLEEMLASASDMLLEKGLATYGEEVVFVAGVPPGVSRTTNVMKLHRIGEPVRLGG